MEFAVEEVEFGELVTDELDTDELDNGELSSGVVYDTCTVAIETLSLLYYCITVLAVIRFCHSDSCRALFGIFWNKTV